MASNVVESEKRRIQRISLPLPSRVEVKINDQVSWNEVTRLTDVSAFGAGFSLKRPLKRGRIVLVTIPMPRQLRCFDYSDPQYRVWSLVRRCVPVRNGEEVRYAIGVAFTGKNPPPGFTSDPSTLYEISHREAEGLWHIQAADTEDLDRPSLSREERRQTRFFIPETVMLEVLDDDGNISATETTVTENISFGGAAVFTSLTVNSGAFVRISSDRYNVKIISVVRGARKGEDGLLRLHLEFIDHFFPLEGIE